MYTGIENPSLDVYNGETNQFLGEATFELSSESQEKLLDWGNKRKPFSSLIVFNLNFRPAAKDYVFPTPFKTYPRKGIFRALFMESSTHLSVPVVIRISYDLRVRSIGPGPNNFNADFNDIIINSTNEAYF